MLTWTEHANFAISIAGLTISLLGLIVILRIPYLKRWTKRYIYIMFSVLSLYIISSLTAQISLSLLGPFFSTLSQLALFFKCLFGSLLMLILTLFIIHISDNSFNTPILYTSVGLWVVFICLLIYSQFSTVIYNVTLDNTYIIGPRYPILIIPPLSIMLVNLVAIIIRRNSISQLEISTLLYVIIIPIMSMILQMVAPEPYFIVMGSSIACFIMLIYILNLGAEKYVEQKLKIAEQDFRAKALQMRPHFIYNTLSNIYYLCELDPKKAQVVIDDFTTYLKKNFSAITTQGLVPFEEELEHTQAFLSVVKTRYEDLLFVDFDTNYKSFKLPTLTLEPLVENAVKHALDPDSDPLYILIRTRKENGFNIITVENNGVDFPSEEEINYSAIEKNNEPHIGISNVRSRLKAFCDGTLKVTNRPGGGTIATIRIPVESTNAIVTGRLFTE